MIRDKDGNVVRNEDGTPLGSVDVNELPGAGAAGEEAQGTTAQQDDTAAQGDESDLSQLHKAELVERAEAAGIDTQGMLKADIVAALQDVEGGDDGDDSVS